MTNASKREAPAEVFETDNSKAGEHFSVAELGRVKNLLSHNNQGE